MNFRGLSAAILGALSLAACASAPRTQGAERFSLDPDNCAPEWKSMKVNQPHLESDTGWRGRPVPFEALAECVQTADGSKVPAALFAIDGEAAPLELQVELHGRREGTLAASLLLLDGNYQTVRQHRYPEFSRRGLDRDISVFINAADARVRYLVLTPDPEFLGAEEESISGQRWTAVWGAAGVIGSYSDGVEQRVMIPLTDTGTVRVVVRPWKTERVQRR